MNSRRQKVPEDRLTTIRRKARSKTSTNARENSEAIPIDLIFEILLRLPARSIARCRCVSKPWASMLRRPDFTELFLTRSRARPQLLFACREMDDDEVIFFSSSQPLETVDNYHMKFKFDRRVELFCPIRDLICFKHKRYIKGRATAELVTLLCNLSTGQSFTLPKMKTRRKVGLESFLGYDPIGKQFKVLSMTSNINGGRGVESEEHQVLTLGTGEPSWRMIDCDIPHFPKRHDIFCSSRDMICIDGVMYYVATPEMVSKDSFIVCFDVRTEKYSYVEALENSISVNHSHGATLINYFGKLAVLRSEESYQISGKSRSFTMCVLEDPEKHEWSKYVYKLPSMWRRVVGKTFLDFVGVTATNEILLAPDDSSDPFHVFYYSLERQTIRRVEIKGLNAVRGSYRVYTYLDHVEDVTLMRAF